MILESADVRDYVFAFAQHLASLPPVSPLAIVVTDEDAYWMSRRGIHSLAVAVKYGLHPVTCVSPPVSPLLDGHSGSATAGRWLPDEKAVMWKIGGQQLVYDYGHSEKRPGGTQSWSVKDLKA